MSALRYHPTRMRWLYAHSVYGDFADAALARASTIVGGHLLGTAAFLDLDRNMKGDLEALEGHYAQWLGSTMRPILDLTNQVDHIRPLEEGDERFQIESLICEEETYFHFGRTVHGYDGFYAQYDEDERCLAFALVGGGDCSDPDLPPAELVASFGPLLWGFLDVGCDIAETVDLNLKDRATVLPGGMDGCIAAVRHMLATLRHVHVMQDAFSECWPGDAPASLVRRAEICMASKAGHRVLPDGGMAQDILWDRGWSEISIIPLPGPEDITPNLDMDQLRDPKRRCHEIARFSRHVVEVERRMGAEGHAETTGKDLTCAIEQAFQAGALVGPQESPFVDLMDSSEEAGKTAWMLGIAAYGKTPGAPVMDARCHIDDEGRWTITIDGDQIDAGSIDADAVYEMAGAGLVLIDGRDAFPTDRLHRQHEFFTPRSRAEDYGRFAWSAR